MTLVYHTKLGQKQVHEEMVPACEAAGWRRVEAPKQEEVKPEVQKGKQS
jgi:hypothetical protein